MKVGVIINSTAKRDAVHFALAPVQAGMILRPGWHIGLNKDGQAMNNVKFLGIVDPFLNVDVQLGQWFWLFLYPGTITTLKHYWEHPCFNFDGQSQTNEVDTLLKQAAAILEREGDKRSVRLRAMTGDKIAESEAWLRDYAFREINTYCHSAYEAYDKLMADLENNEICSYGSDNDRYDYSSEFWEHVAIVLGHPVNPEAISYRCSC